MENFAKYVGVPGLLVIMVTVAVIAWVSVGIEAPREVWILVGSAWTYYFSTNGKVIVNEMKAKANNVTNNNPPTNG